MQIWASVKTNGQPEKFGEKTTGVTFQSLTDGQVCRQRGRQAGRWCKECVPASWSARGGSKGWWWWRRTGRGGARAGALLALRIKAEDSRESPVEQLRRAEDVGRDRRKTEQGGESVRSKKE